MRWFDASVRRVVPSVAALSRRRLLMAPLDLVDRVISMPFGVARSLPPNRLRIRIGVGNRILFNQMFHLQLPVHLWIAAFAEGLVRLDGRILDVGSGCGRFATVLRDFAHYDKQFRGHYTGIDVDAEMVGWCQAHFPADRFTFLLADTHSAVYNPDGSRDPAPFAVEDASQDFVLGTSLLTHLLERELAHYLRETARVLAPGGNVQMTVFCMEHVGADPGGRWTFRHRDGAAYVENERYPEAAVAYEAAHLEGLVADVGLELVALTPGGGHSLLHARRPSAP